MQSMRPLDAIPDDDLLERLATLLRSSRRTEADLVAHLGEVDARRLYAREASPSMWAYCTERLHFSGAEAYLRIAAARASRAHPVLLDMLADGRLHLTAIALLAPYLTPENRDGLLQRAVHRGKREVEELVAEIDPRPDAPARIRKLPDAGKAARAVPSTPSLDGRASPALPLDGEVTRLDAKGDLTRVDVTPPSNSRSATSTVPALRLDEVVSSESEELSARASSGERRDTVQARVAPRGTIEPLSPARYKVEFTASLELRGKLERLRALMRSSVPDGDLAAIIDAAVTEKLERLECRRFGRTKTPRKTLGETDTSPRSRYVPAAVRRAVDDRDQGRCRFVDSQGRRCTARVDLHFHHRRLFAVGGDHSLDNVGLLCRAHNLHMAEIDCGREAIDRHRRSRG